MALIQGWTAWLFQESWPAAMLWLLRHHKDLVSNEMSRAMNQLSYCFKSVVSCRLQVMEATTEGGERMLYVEASLVDAWQL